MLIKFISGCVLIIITTLFTTLSVKGQFIHNLKQLDDNPKNKAATEIIINDIQKMTKENPDHAIKMAHEVLKVAGNHSISGLEARMYMNIGIAYDYKGMYDSAFSNYDKGLKIADLHKLDLIKGDIYNNISITRAILGQMEASIESALAALAIYEEKGDSSRLAKIYNNLGSRYSEMDFSEKALNFYLKAASINERMGEKKRLAYNYGNIGLLYYDQKDHHKALDYFLRSLSLQDTIGNKKDYSMALHNLALAYQQLGEFKKALEYENKAYSLAVELEDDLGKITVLRGMASIMRKQEKYNIAIKHLHEAETIAKRVGARFYLINIYEEFAEVYASTSNFREAFRYNKICDELKDSIQSVQKDKAVSLIQRYENEKKQNTILVLTKDAEIQKLSVRKQKIIKNSFGIVGFLILILAVGLFHRYRYVRKTRNELAEKNQLIKKEKDKTDELLLNILPAQTAEELKTYGQTEARHFDMVTVMFTDFKGFTTVAESMTARELVGEIDYCYKMFDQIISKFNIEKIKTIGDSYMCAGGLPEPNSTNPTDIINAAIEIQRFMLNLKNERTTENKPSFDLRIGIHTGPVIAGVVGSIKYQYDIWGDAVNIASRMESSGEEGKINISQTTYEQVKDRFKCIHRGKILAKNKGEIDMYFVDFS